MKVLTEVFGMKDFRSGQKSVIDALLRGENALALFSTGGGKSLCYQLPALLFPPGELTIVVSPLIALMKDQVDALKAKGIAAEMLGSSQAEDKKIEVRRSIVNGATRILFVAPEQVRNNVTRNLIMSRRIALLAIDEVHCISEWGHEFRPDYLRLKQFATDCGARCVLCLTATATPPVVEDICAAFKIRQENFIRTTFHRPNLRLSFRQIEDSERDTLLVAYLKQTTVARGPSIVYATQRQTTEVVAAMLTKAGIIAKAYHAGLCAADRTAVQEWFMSSDSAVVVATIAFGMGIDKANIRKVVHYNLPKSLEGYAQEIGRAGRDGLPSECLLYYCPDDLVLLEAFVRCETPSCRSVRAIFDFFNMAKPGSVLEASHDILARAHDMTVNTVQMLLAFLDIHHHLVEAMSPTLVGYKSQSAASQQQNSSTLNNRIQAPQKILLHVYRIISLPTSVEDVARTEHARMIARERRALLRLREVVRFITNEEQQMFVHQNNELVEMVAVPFTKGLKCHCQRLVAHFAPNEVIACNGHCRPCSNLSTPQRMMMIHPVLWTKLAAEIRKNVIPGDDPRFLTRFLLGIESPRITALKNHPLYGCIWFGNFDAVLLKCEELCGRKDTDQ